MHTSSSVRDAVKGKQRYTSVDDETTDAHEARHLLDGSQQQDDNYHDEQDGIAMTDMNEQRSTTHDTVKGVDTKDVATALELQQSGASHNVLLDQHEDDDDTAPVVLYRTYKRRWFGLGQLILLNLVISWDWLTFAAISKTSAQYFNVSENAINWLSNAFLFAFCVATPVVLILLHRSPKESIIAASIFTLVGNWIRYAGARKAKFSVLMFGQVINGLAQPFVLTAPTTYSDLWFTERGRTIATAIPSLANPLGGALAQLLSPAWVPKDKPQNVSDMVLYVAIISSVASLPSFFLTARPPTPAAASSKIEKPSTKQALAQMFTNPSFWLVFAPFAIYVGFFNATSSLINQIYEPYGYSEDQAGIGGAILILVGIAASIVASLVVDRTHAYKLIIKILAPIAALSFLILTFTPETRTLAAPYIILAILGASSFSLLPTALEYVVEFTFPVGPETSSVVLWFASQLLGAIFTIVMAALKEDKGSTPPDGNRPPGNLYRALVFQAVLCCVVAVLPMLLGWKRLGLAQEDRKRIAVDGHRETTSHHP